MFGACFCRLITYFWALKHARETLHNISEAWKHESKPRKKRGQEVKRNPTQAKILKFRFISFALSGQMLNLDSNTPPQECMHSTIPTELPDHHDKMINLQTSFTYPFLPRPNFRQLTFKSQDINFERRQQKTEATTFSLALHFSLPTLLLKTLTFFSYFFLR